MELYVVFSLNLSTIFLMWSIFVIAKEESAFKVKEDQMKDYVPKNMWDSTLQQFDYEKEIFLDKLNLYKKIAIYGAITIFVISLAIELSCLPWLSLASFYVQVSLLVTIFLGNIAFDLEKQIDLASDRRSLLPSLIALVIFFGVYVYSAPMLHATGYATQLQFEAQTDSVFEKAINPVKLDRLPQVDEFEAKRIATGLMGAIKGLGSNTEVGKMTRQPLTCDFEACIGYQPNGEKIIKRIKFDDDLVWVAPLEFKGFSAWTAMDGTPAYFIISATNETIAYMIMEVNGKPVCLKYLESAWFWNNIHRMLRKNGFATKALKDFNCELNPQGELKQVISICKPQIGVFAMAAVGTVVVDVQKGAIEEYTVENTPEWVNCIQPEEVILNQITWWGNYSGGFWNYCWSKKGLEEPTEGLQKIENNGKRYYYTGIQSTGSDDATSAYMLIDTRTGKVLYFKKEGYNESSAMNSMNGNKFISDTKGNYFVNTPIFCNVYNVETYFSVIKSSQDGRRKGYAFCSLRDKIVGVGETLEGALADYLKNIYEQQNKVVLQDAEALELTETLKIKDIRQIGECYYFLFEKYPDNEFYAYSAMFPKLKWIDNPSSPQYVTVKVSFQIGKDFSVPLSSIEKIE